MVSFDGDMCETPVKLELKRSFVSYTFPLFCFGLASFWEKHELDFRFVSQSPSYTPLERNLRAVRLTAYKPGNKLSGNEWDEEKKPPVFSQLTSTDALDMFLLIRYPRARM